MTTVRSQQEEDADEELEPLFDYRRVQPTMIFRFDDSDLEKAEIFKHCNKRPKVDAAEGEEADGKGAAPAGAEKAKVVDVEDDEDWLAPPPPLPKPIPKEDSLSRELRLKKQELAKITESAQDILRKLEESANKEVDAKERPEQIILDDEHEPQAEKGREKIVLCVQGADGKQQFRIYKDDQFDKLFKAYAKKVKLNPSELIFVFDGEKIDPSSTPENLELEDNDMIEVRKLEESANKEVGAKEQPEQIMLDDQHEPQAEKAREKIVLSVQGTDGKQQFRIYKDDQFNKLFKAYAKKVKLNPSELIFVFDGEKIDPSSTPENLDLEDNDLIEVSHKKRS